MTTVQQTRARDQHADCTSDGDHVLGFGGLIAGGRLERTVLVGVNRLTAAALSGLDFSILSELFWLAGGDPTRCVTIRRPDVCYPPLVLPTFAQAGFRLAGPCISSDPRQRCKPGSLVPARRELGLQVLLSALVGHRAFFPSSTHSNGETCSASAAAAGARRERGWLAMACGFCQPTQPASRSIRARSFSALPCAGRSFCGLSGLVRCFHFGDYSASANARRGGKTIHASRFLGWTMHAWLTGRCSWSPWVGTHWGECLAPWQPR